MFRENRSAINFELTWIQKQQPTKVVVTQEQQELLSQSLMGVEMLEKYSDTESDTFISVGRSLFNIKVDKDNLALFN